MIILARGLTFDGVNLLMNDYASGLPSPLAFLGLAAAIAPALGVGRWGVGVLPILHEVTDSAGRTKPEMINKAGSFAPGEIFEDMTGRVVASLLFDIDAPVSPKDIADALEGRRLAGGGMSSLRVEARAVASDGSALKGVARGYALIRPDEPRRCAVSTGSTESLEHIADLLWPVVSEPGWRVPVAVGHRMLEDPDTVPARRNTRNPDIPHVFVEPAVGLAELVSVRNARMTEADPETFADLFWRWHTPAPWILAHPAYDPTAIKET